MSTKLRVTLSAELLTTINTLANCGSLEELESLGAKISEEHYDEISRVIAPALFKLGIGTIKPAYIAKGPKELTLEQKVSRGIATPEEEELYFKQLQESL